MSFPLVAPCVGIIVNSNESRNINDFLNIGNNNAYVVSRRTGGGVRFSRDPLNLKNMHTRKYAGFVNEKAVGVVPNENGGVKILSKKASASQKPAANFTSTTFHGGKSARR